MDRGELYTDKLPSSGIAQLQYLSGLPRQGNMRNVEAPALNLHEYEGFDINSKYDKYAGNIEQLYEGGSNLNNVREAGQSTIARLGNGLANNLAIFGTTLVDLVGFQYGNAYNIYKGMQGDIQTPGETLNNLFNNDFTQTTAAFRDYVKENMPNYKGQRYEDMSMFRKLFSGAFLADIVEMMGYVEGMAIPGGMANAAVQGVKWLPKAAKIALPAMISALGESATEGVNDYNESVEKNNQVALNNYRLKSWDPTLTNEQRQQLYNEYLQAREQINQDAIKQSNADFIGNLALLSVSNSIQFPKLLIGGLGTQKKLFNSLFKGKPQDILKSGFKKLSNTKVTTRAVARGLVDAATEGNEEMLQSVLSSAPEYNEMWNSFNSNVFNEGAAIKVTDFLNAYGQGFVETYTDKQAWEEFMAGAVLGVFGAPTPSVNSKGRASVSWGGGIFGDIAEDRRRVRDTNALADYLNSRLGNETIQFYRQNIINSAIQDDMNRFAQEGDDFNWHNAASRQMFNDIYHYWRAGRLDVLEQMVDNAMNLDDEAIQEMIDNEQGENGVFRTNGVAKSVAEVRESLQKKGREYKDYIEQFVQFNKKLIESDFFQSLENATIADMLYFKHMHRNFSLRATTLMQEIEQELGEGVVKDLNEIIENPELNRIQAINAVNEYILQKMQEKQKTKEEQDIILQKINDLNKVRVANARVMQELDKIYLDPYKALEKAAQDAEKKKQKDIDKQKESLEKQLNKVTTVKEVRTLLQSPEFNSFREEFLNNPTNEVVKKYKEVEGYKESIIKNINNNPNLNETEKQMALQLLQETFDNAESVDDIKNFGDPDYSLIYNQNLSTEENDAIYSKLRQAIYDAKDNARQQSEDGNRVHTDTSNPEVPKTDTKPTHSNDGPEITTTENEKKKREQERKKKEEQEKKKREQQQRRNRQPNLEDEVEGQIEPNEEDEEIGVIGEDTNNQPTPPPPPIPDENLVPITSTEDTKPETPPTPPPPPPVTPNEIIPVWYPGISEVALEAGSDVENGKYRYDFRPFDEVYKEQTGVDLSKIYSYLKNHGAFDFLNSGGLKPGMRLQFMIDPTIGEDVIFITTEVNGQQQVVGVLGNKNTQRYAGLTEARDAIQKEYREANDTSKPFMSSYDTTVKEVRGGKIPYSKEEKTLSEIPDSEKFHIAIAQGGVLKFNPKAPNLPILGNYTLKDGRIYMLIPDGAGHYIPISLRSKVLDKTLVNTKMFKRIDSILQQLVKVRSQETFDRLIGDLKHFIYIPSNVHFDYIETDYGKSIVIAVAEVNKDGQEIFEVNEKGERRRKENKTVIKISENRSGDLQVLGNDGITNPETYRSDNEIYTDLRNWLLKQGFNFQIDLRTLTTLDAKDAAVYEEMLREVTTANVQKAGVMDTHFTMYPANYEVPKPSNNSSSRTEGNRVTTPVGGTESVVEDKQEVTELPTPKKSRKPRKPKQAKEETQTTEGTIDNQIEEVVNPESQDTSQETKNTPSINISNLNDRQDKKRVKRRTPPKHRHINQTFERRLDDKLINLSPMSIAEFAKKFRIRSNNPVYNKILQWAKSSGLTIKFGSLEDSSALGMYQEGQIVLQIDPNNPEFENTFMHELIHAALEYIAKSDNLTLEQQAAKEELFRLYDYYNELLGEYRLDDVEEFIAELGNPKFVEKLDRISARDKSFSLKDLIMRILAKIFHINTNRELDLLDTYLERISPVTTLQNFLQNKLNKAYNLEKSIEREKLSNLAIFTSKSEEAVSESQRKEFMNLTIEEQEQKVLCM